MQHRRLFMANFIIIVFPLVSLPQASYNEAVPLVCRKYIFAGILPATGKEE